MNLVWKRRTAAVAVTLIAGFGLAACGDDDQSDNKSESSQSDDSDDNSGRENREKLLADETPDNFMARVIDAQYDESSFDFAMNMSMQGMEIDATGQMFASDDPADAAMSLEMEYPGVGTMTMILVDQTFYMSMGSLTGDKFVVLDSESEEFGAQFDEMFEQMDPSAQLETLDEAIISFEPDGDPEEMDGVEATPYLLELDTEAILESSGQDTSSLDGVDLPETVEYTIWVGDDDLPRRIDMDLMGTEMTMEFSNWGTDVDIEAPSDDEISDIDPFSMTP